MLALGTDREMNYNLIQLKRNLNKSCVFPGVTSKISTLVGDLSDRYQEDPTWYEKNNRLSYDLLDITQKMLLFARKNLIVDDTRRNELILLRKARILLQLNIIRKELLALWRDVEDLFFSTSLSEKMTPEIFSLFERRSFKETLNSDFSHAKEQFAQVFGKIHDAFPGYEISSLALACQDKMANEHDEGVAFEIFDDTMYDRAAVSISEYLLTLDPQSDRFLSKANLDFMPAVVPQVTGKFGEIFVGNLKMIDGSSSERVSLQVMNSKILSKCNVYSRANAAAELGLLITYPHPALLKILGFTKNKSDFFIAFEPVQRNLNEFLHGSTEWKLAPSVLSTSQALTVIFCVARAVSQLHFLGVVHGDIRPENVYISSGPVEQHGCVAKLANFSYGMNRTEQSDFMTTPDDRYKAPELFSGMDVSMASDVYALSICLWEIFQDNRLPFDHIRDEEISRKVIMGERPQFSTKEPQWAQDLLNMSWVPEKWLRPTAKRWKQLFESLIQNQEVDIQKANTEITQTMKRMSVHTANLLSQRRISRPQQLLMQYNHSHQTDDETGSVFSLGSVRSNMPLRRNQYGSASEVNIKRAMSVETINEYELRKLGDADNDKSVDNFEKHQIADDLREFYTENDPGKLDENFETIVKYCMTNGLRFFNESLIRDYGKGLRRFQADSLFLDKTPVPQSPKKNSFNSKSRAKRNKYASMFFTTKKSKKKKKNSDNSVNANLGDSSSMVSGFGGGVESQTMRRVEKMNAPIRGQTSSPRPHLPRRNQSHAPSSKMSEEYGGPNLNNMI